MRLIKAVGASLCVLVFTSLTSTASATGFFAVEGSSLTLEEKEKSGISPAGLRLRLGTPINRLMDVEAHYGFSFRDKDKEHRGERHASNGDSIEASYYGLYLKAHLPVGYNSSLFAVAGMSTVNSTRRLIDSTIEDSRSGGSYGFGMETRLTEHADLTADYMSYLRDEGLFEEVSSFNFGVKFYF